MKDGIVTLSLAIVVSFLLGYMQAYTPIEYFIGVMSVTGFVFWVLAFAWFVGFAHDKITTWRANVRNGRS